MYCKYTLRLLKLSFHFELRQFSNEFSTSIHFKFKPLLTIKIATKAKPSSSNKWGGQNEFISIQIAAVSK